jgi:type IV pilus assembly protein PilA
MVSREPQYSYQQQPAPPPPPKKGMSCGLIALIVAGAMVPILGVLSALAIYGVRRYLAAARTSEAKASVMAIARGGEAAYGANGKLCTSASAVPAVVPSGQKYQSGAGDYDTGSDDAGWRCLRFSMSTPQYYQYNYNQGGGYLGPGIGGDGFEAAAVGDIDGDHTTSLFAVTAALQPDGSLEMSRQIYIEAELE